MSFDTREHNSQRRYFDQCDSFWLFGYGSLIWKAGFAYLERRPASIFNWSRRFWHGSHDHRGTVQSPGRVVTLIKDEGARCDGMAYRITPAVLADLDIREKNGYLRELIPIYLSSQLSGAPSTQVSGLVYIATADSEAYLGEAPLLAIAQQIVQAKGPSGENRDYLLNLDNALRQLGMQDEHVSQLAAHVQQISE
ncbi:gamma-glutamylcyclotransferase [Oceanisphaera avium]|uniref:glutathione-specific gamma-glutamylcyclotransferase n=1 Tax=Oceanisphaera avium TaxID=1903694 RepID=A0A1Y0CZ46_9GAMM|nr:gamma-glutamylcyclotransferase [Oceanisphaera avium]ART80582.1 gamma-glutamylcyclotransferase [Oceanisphaera avium]